MDEGFVSNNGIKLHYIAEGPQDGEPVLLLHGFPQFSYMWRNQMAALAGAGYRAVAADLRGYNLSDKPTEVEQYQMSQLVTDVGAFYQHFGWRKANLVVHDWGGGIGWIFTTYQQKLVSKFVAIDIPHTGAYLKAMRQGTEQLRESWYIWLFQAAGAAEQYFGANDCERLINWLFVEGRSKGQFSAEELARYREMLRQPGQLTAAFNYYRANTNPQRALLAEVSPIPPLQVPTLLINGKDDFAFARAVWEDTASYCTGPYRHVELEGVSHWACEEAPQEVNRLILEHLAS